ncbi:MAG: hypothetical protein LQ339_004285 [Xanthoria mediterranea]|nr:MAG: hypothetical protein LQ339_004285 [Xanthoria mediterranea]
MLIWADLLWTWIFIPIITLVTSLNTVTATETITDLVRGVCDFYLSLSGLIHQATKQVLEFLAWIYFYPIDRDAVEDTEPQTPLKSQTPDHDDADDRPWNAPELWSYIESETGADPPTEENIPNETRTTPKPQSQALVLHQHTSSTASNTTISSPSVHTPTTDPDPPPDAITLRARPGQQYPAPRSPTITDNINQIHRMKAAKDNPNLPTHTQAPRKSAPTSPTTNKANATSAAKDRPNLHHRKPSHSDNEDEVEAIRTPDLDFEELWFSSDDEGDDLNGCQPLVSTVVPTRPMQERWEAVFHDAKDKDEELDRFEAALGKGGS